jgi:adenylate cyclase
LPRSRILPHHANPMVAGGGAPWAAQSPGMFTMAFLVRAAIDLLLIAVISALAFLSLGLAPVSFAQLTWQDEVNWHYRSSGGIPIHDDVRIIAVPPLDDDVPSREAALAALIRAIAPANPQAIGIDVHLPFFERKSYEQEQVSLETAIADAAEAGIPVVIGVDGLAARFGAAPAMATRLASNHPNISIGYDLWRPMRDGAIRDFNPLEMDMKDRLQPTFAAQMLARLGQDPIRGTIDMAAGTRLTAIDGKDILRDGINPAIGREIQGKVVLIGDPVDEADSRRTTTEVFFPSVPYTVPDVALAAQVIRTQLAGRTDRIGAYWVVFSIVAAICALWWLRIAIANLLALPLAGAILVACSLALRTGTLVTPVGAIVGIALALLVKNGRAFRTEIRTRLCTLLAVRGYLPAEAVSRFIATSERAQTWSERRRMTFLFADLREFTAFSEEHEPEVVVTRLNVYLSAMTEVIHSYGGTVDKFRGDGLMAWFDSQNAMTGADATAAIRAGFAMLERAAAINQSKASGLEPLRIGIGIARGEVIVGNVGSATRRDFTAIGSAVNRAAHLESLCKVRDTTMIVDAPALHAALLSESERRWLTIASAVTVPKHGPLDLYELRPVSPAALETLS